MRSTVDHKNHSVCANISLTVSTIMISQRGMNMKTKALSEIVISLIVCSSYVKCELHDLMSMVSMKKSSFYSTSDRMIVY